MSRTDLTVPFYALVVLLVATSVFSWTGRKEDRLLGVIGILGILFAFGAIAAVWIGWWGAQTP